MPRFTILSFKTLLRVILISVAIPIQAQQTQTALSENTSRYEIKFSGLSPGLHFEYFFHPQFSVDAGVRYSPFSFHQVGGSRMSREVTRALLNTRYYFGNTSKGIFYTGIFGCYTHQFAHQPYKLIIQRTPDWVKYDGVAAGVEFGLKIPMSERLSVEVNAGCMYNLWARYSYRIEQYVSPVLPVSEDRAFNTSLMIDSKSSISINYLIK